MAESGTSESPGRRAGGRPAYAAGPDTAKVEQMKAKGEKRAGTKDIMMLQEQYEYLMRRNIRVLGTRQNTGKLVAGDSTYYPRG